MGPWSTCPPLHSAGDISYADNRAGLYNGSIYDGVLNQFYNEVMPSSAYAPYMTSSGRVGSKNQPHSPNHPASNS